MSVSSIRKHSEALNNLYSLPLPSHRTGPLYNAFSYPTKISPEAIAVFIATHTKPGANVLDAFGGSGTTGLAALLCDRPTNAMLDLAAKLGVSPKWGARNAHIYEISSLGTFVAKTLCNPPDPVKFFDAVKKLLSLAESSIGWVYKAQDPDGVSGRVRHIIWSDVLICPECNSEQLYWDVAVQRKPLALQNTFACQVCNHKVAVDKSMRATEKVYDSFGVKNVQKKRVPVRIYGSTGTKRWARDLTADDIKLIKKIDKAELPISAPDKEIIWGDLYRAGYHTGITKLHHFYTKRNFLVISTLWNLLEEFDKDVRDALRLLLLSYNSTHSTLMTRVVIKKNQNDFVLTGAQSGVLYISGLPVEKNILEGILRKSKTFVDSFRLIYGSSGKVIVYNKSSEKMSLQEGSIDYVFTDPPFGDYIPYAEINQINELWLGNITNRKKELIVSPSQGKTVVHYEQMMSNVFREIFRVLKPDGMATVVFHSAHSNIWRALVSSYIKAGFSVSATSVLDKIQSSFKQVVSEVSVKGDPLLLLSKKSNAYSDRRTCLDIAIEVIANTNYSRVRDDAVDVQRLYSTFISNCLKVGVEVDIDAKVFFSMAKKSQKVLSL
ncbi:MAG: DNA methyltransferase [Pseudomonadota bacterium]